MNKYTYKVNTDIMEEVYLLNTNTDFFADPADREKFNAELVIYAENEEDSIKIRSGITHIPMWELVQDTNR
jgi:hypothetical protein